mgnify:CR=1 FL=1
MLRTALTALAGLALIAAACGSPDSPEAGNPLDLERDSEQQQCIQNMYEICYAQSMHYGMYNEYMTEIEQVYEYMGEVLTCPSCGQAYLLESSGERYTVTCPFPEIPNHGSYGSNNPPPNPEVPDIEECRSNMLGIATAQAIYYGYNNEYADGFYELCEVCVVDSICPACAQTYLLDAEEDHYRLICPCSTDPEHGSVVDGIASW